MLDAGEHFHLALQEMQQGSSEKAIEHLKQCLDMEPDNAKALYLLGVMHTELGMYERAIEEMSHAIKLDDSLSIACFQLGLLHFTLGNNDAAKEVWLGLDKLGEQDPLFLFKRGMLHSTQQDFAECIADLEAGIALNLHNPALNKDMQQLIVEARKHIGKDTASAIQDIAPSRSGPTKLSAYSQDND